MIRTLASLRERFAHHAPRRGNEDVRVRAAVAMVVREEAGDLSLLFIQRSEHEDDRWSGDIAFPGGRVDACDVSPRAAAERETLEEVGLRLSEDDYIGQLDDLMGTSESILVSAFVYGTTQTKALEHNHEVEQIVWLPLSQIESPARHVERTFRYLEHELPLPGLRVLESDETVLWGLSYRFLQLFMEKTGRFVPEMPWHDDL